MFLSEMSLSEIRDKLQNLELTMLNLPNQEIKGPYFLISVFVSDILPLKSVRTVGDHEFCNPLPFTSSPLHNNSTYPAGHAQIDLQPLRVRSVLGTPGHATL